jgi:C-methyltransferase C-terminal domain/Putative zinc binding domain/Methyltransferase domain
MSFRLIDLGTAPPSNAYLTAADLDRPERYFPLRVQVCQLCWLVQTEDFAQAHELFAPDYAYYSSFSASWLRHAEQYVDDMCMRFGLGSSHLIAEVAANDGYLLQYVKKRGIPCYGIEPTTGPAAAAKRLGIEVEECFLGKVTAGQIVAQKGQAHLIAANNVLAHVPDINDFVSAFPVLLARDGVATFEFPHLVNLIDQGQFDTIYHEHYSYLSLHAVEKVFSANGLSVFDVEQIATHGGSLRIFAQRADVGGQPETAAVGHMRELERGKGITTIKYYADFQCKATRVRETLLRFLLDAHARGETVAAYGAAAKGNTLLNFAGVREDLVTCVADRNPSKQGKYLPGSRIPVVGEDALSRLRPNWILLLPWNLRSELVSQLAYVRQWGAKFATFVPELEVE